MKKILRWNIDMWLTGLISAPMFILIVLMNYELAYADHLKWNAEWMILIATFLGYLLIRYMQHQRLMDDGRVTWKSILQACILCFPSVVFLLISISIRGVLSPFVMLGNPTTQYARIAIVLSYFAIPISIFPEFLYRKGRVKAQRGIETDVL